MTIIVSTLDIYWAINTFSPCSKYGAPNHSQNTAWSTEVEFKKCSSTKIFLVTLPNKRDDLNNETTLFQMCWTVLEA